MRSPSQDRKNDYRADKRRIEGDYQQKRSSPSSGGRRTKESR